MRVPQFIDLYTEHTIHFVVPPSMETSNWGQEKVPQQIALGRRMTEMGDVPTTNQTSIN